MKRAIFILFSYSVVILCGCNKPAPTGIWAGSYLNTLNGAADSLAEVYITYVSNNSVNITLQINEEGYLYTATTLQNVILNDTSATIDQDQHIIEATDLGPFHFQGTAMLNSSALTLNVTATDLSTNNPSDNKVFQFSGAKVQ